MTSIETPLSAAFRSVASTACGSKSKATTGSKPEFRRGDREDAGATADVEDAPPLLAGEQLEAELRRRMPAGPERAARIDHDRDRAVVGSLPRRPDPQRSDANRLVELPPAVLPVVLDDGGRGAAERLPDSFFTRSVRVRGELEPTFTRDLFESLGEELDHHGARLLGPCVGDGDRDAAQKRHADPGIQRMAFLSFSKKPSSRRYVSSSESASKRSSSSRCSSVSCRGTATLTSTR